jgi:hypothetical protein
MKNDIIIFYPPDLLFSSTEKKIEYIDEIIKAWTKEKKSLQEQIKR